MAARVAQAEEALGRDNEPLGAALVAKDASGRLPALSVSDFGQPSSIRPELTGMALALDCICNGPAADRDSDQ
jgi:hypothetical protein